MNYEDAFISINGSEYKIVFEKKYKEYRAYKKNMNGWDDMKMGSGNKENLIEYITRKEQ